MGWLIMHDGILYLNISILACLCERKTHHFTKCPVPRHEAWIFVVAEPLARDVGITDGLQVVAVAFGMSVFVCQKARLIAQHVGRSAFLIVDFLIIKIPSIPLFHSQGTQLVTSVFTTNFWMASCTSMMYGFSHQNQKFWKASTCGMQWSSNTTLNIWVRMHL